VAEGIDRGGLLAVGVIFKSATIIENPKCLKLQLAPRAQLGMSLDDRMRMENPLDPISLPAMVSFSDYGLDVRARAQILSGPVFFGVMS
jgi:hypothetical protein